MSDATPVISVEAVDRATAAVESLTRMLRTFERAYHSNPSAKVERFRRLCFDLFRDEMGGPNMRPELRAATSIVTAVEIGTIGRRGIAALMTERFPALSGEERAFAVGLAMGFMTEFLPREG